MLKWLIRLVTELAFAISKRAQVNRVDEGACFHRGFGIRRVIDHRVTDVAVIGNDLSVFTDVVAVVTTEAT